MHTALVGWIEGLVLALECEGSSVARISDARGRQWRGGETRRDGRRRRGRCVRRYADARLLDRVLVHWALCVEVRRSGDGSILRRAFSRWWRATREGANRDVASAGEKAVVALARARERRVLHIAFLSWGCKRRTREARAFAMELLASERIEGDSALCRLKARRRGA